MCVMYVQCYAHILTTLPFTIGQVQVLEKLFELRFSFHQLAALCASDHNMAAVCWVDNILAKLGEAVHCVIGNDKIDALVDEQHYDWVTLKKHKEDCALRAAIQLPRTCIDSNSRI